MGTAPRSAEFWWSHVAMWRSSGQSRREYCTAHGPVRKTFDWWAWRFDQERSGVDASDAEPRFVPVDVSDSALAEVCCAVTPAAENDDRIEIAWLDGVRVRVGRHVDTETLCRVLRVLGR
jgi:hypothetical protein